MARERAEIEKYERQLARSGEGASTNALGIEEDD